MDDTLNNIVQIKNINCIRVYNNLDKLDSI
jgi:hypothetical protein